MTRRACPFAAALATAAALGAGLAAGAPAAVVLVRGANSGAVLRVDSHGDALVTWHQGATTESVLVPPSGQLSHGGVLSGADVSRRASDPGLPDAVSVRKTPDGRLWALQEIQVGAQAPVELDLSRWRGGPTVLSLSLDGSRLRGAVSFHGTPASGASFTLAGAKPRIYVYLDCFGCLGRSGWNPMLGVAPRRDGSFAVLLRPTWRGSRYRATVVGKNIGSTLAPDAETTVASS
jgi:hypothetical protein